MISKSLKAAGFRHEGSTLTEEERRQMRILNALSHWVLSDEVGCADLGMGMSVDLREVMVCVKKQNPKFQIDPKLSFVRALSGGVFEISDEHMNLRQITMALMQQTEWRIRLVTSSVIIKTALSRLVVRVTLGQQDSPMFNMYPLMRMKVPDDTDMVYELGPCAERFDYYLEGSIWLAPTSLILTNL